MEFLIQNLQTIITVAVALFVLLLLYIAWRAIRPSISGGRRGQRLSISEYYELDKERRLVLVKRDNVEHLILIGGPQDMVIEQGIGAILAQPQRTAPSGAYEATPPAGTARPAPRAPSFVERKAAPPLRPGDGTPAGAPRQEPEL